MSMVRMYESLAKQAARYSGRPVTFLIASLTVIIWAVSGPIFDYSDTWQLVINTGTTIVTFLMVFLIQNTQNSDTTAIQVKLDELIRTNQSAQNILLDLENMDMHSLEAYKQKYKQLAEEARKLHQSTKDASE